MRIVLMTLVFMFPLLMGHMAMVGPEAAFGQTGAASADERMTLLTPESVKLGDPFLIRLTSLDPLEETTVHWLGREVVPAVSVWNDKHVVLAMLGTDVKVTKPGPSELVVVCTVGGRHFEFSRSVTVGGAAFSREPDSATAPLSRGDLVRVALDAKESAKAMNADTPLRRWFLPFDRPVEGAVVGPYGSERVVNGRTTFRRGLDFVAEPGTPVKACGSGSVVLLADHLMAGKSVYLDHGNGVVSMYFHLSRADVILGQSVTRGDLLGLSGSSGRSEVAKLHFGVAVQGRLVDPEPLFNNKAEGLLPQ